MPAVSVVIVNYNVKYFIRQCLQSLYQSSIADQMEVIVVDNNSTDGSVRMIRNLYPDVKLIENPDNKGFSKANNQGIQLATSDHILILNPDTVVQENTIASCLRKLNSSSDIGAVCVKMYDGSGNYLPESKRGFPTPARSLFKMLGMSTLFSKSSFFNGYYQGHLDPEKDHRIEVLTGAFALLKKEALEATGGLDEDYFMYGEDIELSYQLDRKGYSILYNADTSIIHFKGESTNKAGIRYLKNFYGAMGIYARKRGKQSRWIWNTVLYTGITCSAIAGAIKSLAYKYLRPIMDALLLISMAFVFSRLWAQYYHNNPDYYDYGLLAMVIPLASMVILFCYYIFGQYDRQHNVRHLIYGFVSSTLVVLSVYSLLPSELRFSRAILLVLVLTSPVILYCSRKVYNFLINNNASFAQIFTKRVAIVGNPESCKEVHQIITTLSDDAGIIGNITPNRTTDNLGTLEEIQTVVQSRDINELVFCSKDISSADIFHVMTKLGRQVSYKIANDDNSGILGSDSKNRVGEWYTLDIGYKIDQVFHRRTKRYLDILIALLLLITFPLWVVLSPQRGKVLKSWAVVLTGKLTWIGYNLEDIKLSQLPALKPSVFEISQSPGTKDVHYLNLHYARNYTIWLDLQYLIQKLFETKV